MIPPDSKANIKQIFINGLPGFVADNNNVLRYLVFALMDGGELLDADYGDLVSKND